MLEDAILPVFDAGEATIAVGRQAGRAISEIFVQVVASDGAIAARIVVLDFALAR